MRIKKLTAILLTAAMALSLAACEAKPQETEAFDVNAFYEKAETEVCDGLTQISESEDYLKLFSKDITENDFYQACRGAKRVEDGTVYEMTLDDDTFNTIFKAASDDESLDNFPDFEKEYIRKKVCSSIPNLYNGTLGVNAIILSSVVTYSKTYVPAGEVVDTLRVVSTDKDDVYMWVCYINVGDGAVSVTTAYLPVGKDGIALVNEYFNNKLVEVTK